MLTSCTNDTLTEVVVTLRADNEVAAEATRLEVSVEIEDAVVMPVEEDVGDAGPRIAECLLPPCSRAILEPSFPARVPVVRLAASTAERVQITARWFDDEDQLRGEVTGIFPFIEGESLRAELQFDADCDGVECLVGSCVAGICRGDCWAREGEDWATPERCGECEECLEQACAPGPDLIPCANGCSGHTCLAGICTAAGPRNLDTTRNATCVTLGIEVRCWGDPDVVANVGVDGTENDYTQLALGHDHRCTRSSIDQIFCGGQNDWGQLGQNYGDGELPPEACQEVENGSCSCGDPQRYFVPPASRGIERVVNPTGARWARVAAGDQATCATDDAGALYCWGNSFEARLGEPTRQNPCDGCFCSPLAIAAPSRVTYDRREEEVPEELVVLPESLAYGERTGCVLIDSTHIFCWGWPFVGNVGIVPDTSGLSAGFVTELAQPVDRVFVGPNVVCVRQTADHHVLCRGEASRGHLGAGEAFGTDDTHLFQPIDPPLAFDTVGLSATHGCGITDDARLFCWGAREQLGTYATGDAFSPVEVGGAGWEKLAVGYFHTCATRGGALYCWGLNGFGQADPSMPSETIEEPRLLCFDRIPSDPV